MTSVERLARLAKPAPAKRRRPSAGDGRVCPGNPKHGPMVRLTGSTRQWCPHSEHDGSKSQPSTRCFWPGVEEQVAS